MIHFIAVFIRASFERREDFAKYQNATEELEFKSNTRPRWNSTFYMLQRALKLRKTIDLFSLQYIESKKLNKRFKLNNLV
jgi:hypothetical protein